MSRTNNIDARMILCNMVSEKAEAKRDKLMKDLIELDDKISVSRNKQAKAARRKIEATFTDVFKSKIGSILTKYKFGRMEFFYDKSGECRCCVVNDEERKRLRSTIEKELTDLDARIRKAQQEIRLRVALGMKYDEAVAIVDGFQF